MAESIINATESFAKIRFMETPQQLSTNCAVGSADCLTNLEPPRRKFGQNDEQLLLGALPRRNKCSRSGDRADCGFRSRHSRARRGDSERQGQRRCGGCQIGSWICESRAETRTQRRGEDADGGYKREIGAIVTISPANRAQTLALASGAFTIVMKASIKLRLRTPFGLAAPEMPRANVSRLQGLHQGPVTTWSVTLFALYFTTKCSLESMLAPFTVAKRPLTELAVRIPNTLPRAGTKPLSRPMFSVPLKLAVPVTASRSNCVPGLVPAILMSRAPAGFCV